MTRALTLAGALALTILASLLMPADLDAQRLPAIASSETRLAEARDRTRAVQEHIRDEILRRDETEAAISRTKAELELLGRLLSDAAADADTLAEGPGLRLTLNDASAPDGTDRIVHDASMLAVFSALKNGGAEAISVNGVALREETYVKCGGPTIWIGSVALAPPYAIQAIGNAGKLRAALMTDAGSPGKALEEQGLLTKMETLERVTIRFKERETEGVAWSSR